MARPKLNGVRTHIIIPTPLKKRLDDLAQLTGITISDHVRRAIELYLIAAEKQ